MSVVRRIGTHPNEFSREIRAVSGGGTIPDEWNCRVVDLDELLVAIGEQVLLVCSEGRIWAWYRDPIEVVALAEMKNEHDIQQSWVVTRSLAVQASVPGYCILRRDQGNVVVTDLEMQRREYASVRDFVGAEIRPLIGATH